MEFNAWYKIRRFVYDNLHNDDYESTFSRCVNFFLILLIISNTVAVLLESINDVYLLYQLYFDTFELFSIFVFTVEYLLRFWAVAEKIRLTVHGKIDGYGCEVVVPSSTYFQFYPHILTSLCISIYVSYESLDYLGCLS